MHTKLSVKKNKKKTQKHTQNRKGHKLWAVQCTNVIVRRL